MEKYKIEPNFSIFIDILFFRMLMRNDKIKLIVSLKDCLDRSIRKEYIGSLR